MEKSDLPNHPNGNLSQRHDEAQEALSRAVTSTQRWNDRARSLPFPLATAFSSIAGLGTFAATKNPELSGHAAIVTFITSYPLTYAAAKTTAWLQDFNAATCRHELERVEIEMETIAAFNAERAQIFTPAKPETLPPLPVTVSEKMLARAEARRHREMESTTAKPHDEPYVDLHAQHVARSALIAAAVLHDSPSACSSPTESTTAKPRDEPYVDLHAQHVARSALIATAVLHDSPSACSSPKESGTHQNTHTDHGTGYSSPTDTGSSSSTGFDGGSVCAPQML